MAEFSALPFNDGNARALWHYIATGSVLDEAWYRDLDRPDDTSNNISEYITSHRTQVNTDYIPDEISNFQPEEDHHDDVDMNSEISEDVEEDITEQVISEYQEQNKKFNAFMFENLHDKGMMKALLKLTKFMEKQSKKKNIQTLKRKLFDLCHESKKKIGNHIPVQNTSIGRRRHKNRGRVVSGYGRRHKDTALTPQLVVLEDQDNVYPSLNPQTRRSNRIAHDLSTAVSRNVSNARKH